MNECKLRDNFEFYHVIGPTQVVAALHFVDGYRSLFEGRFGHVTFVTEGCAVLWRFDRGVWTGGFTDFTKGMAVLDNAKWLSEVAVVADALWVNVLKGEFPSSER